MSQNLAKGNNYLVSNKLSHSYSKIIHNAFGVNYELREISEANLDFDFGFINITIPFKSDYVKLADVKSEEVNSTNACNLIIKKDKYYAYNTDILGIEYTFKSHNIDLSNKRVLILGSGATSKSLIYFLNRYTTNIKILSRKDGSYLKEDYYDADILINATPHSMFPKVDFNNLVDLTKFNNLTFVFDLVYNPFMTPLLISAKELGISYANGIEMLVYQAYSVYKLANIIPTKTVLEVINLLNQKKNIALIGMPSSGKSTMSRTLAKILNKEVIEFDSLNQINIKESEKEFRKKENELIKEYSLKTDLIFSLGGGAILNAENIAYLRLNSIIFYIDISLDELLKRDFYRPLITSKEDYINLCNVRKDLYEKYADYKVRTVEEIVEIFCNQWT